MPQTGNASVQHQISMEVEETALASASHEARRNLWNSRAHRLGFSLNPCKGKKKC